MPGQWPKTMARGVLSGRTFQDAQEYAAALKEARGAAGDDNASGEVAPRRARAPRGPAVTLEMAQGLFQFGNMVLAIVPYTREDVLEDVEIRALALGVVDAARSNKALANIIVKVCAAQSTGNLGIAVGAVVTRRLSRRGIVPEFAGIMAESVIESIANGSPTVPAAPVEVEVEVTPNGLVTA